MEDMTCSTFGDLLKGFRKHSKITQQELATRLGVHRNTIGTWERGDFLPESKTIVLELAHQLHLDTRDTRRLLEASLTSLSPYWLMPYTRNPFFTGREDILCQLHEALHYEQAAMLSQSYALSGLGGIGKTQTAVEYAYRYADDYAAVFWVNAESTESIISSFVSIADLLDLPEKQKKEQNLVVAAVTHWLAIHKDWLLIFDNVEEPGLIKEVLPATRRGSLLFTSRRQALGLSAQVLNLEPMMAEEGVHFLLYRARLLHPPTALDHLLAEDVACAREIVAVMGGLPLALDQAGAYIEATQCGLSTYLHHFCSSQFCLLDEQVPYAEHPSSVVRTFLMAFERVQQINSLAAEILTVCAFLSPEAIPETFFTAGAAQPGGSVAALAADPWQFDMAIKELLVYSLLRRDGTAHTLTIHRLVQAVLRGSLQEEDEQQWSARVMSAMARFFPAEKILVDYWQICEHLLPHALICILRAESGGRNGAECITLMNHVAAYLSKRARFTESEALYERALCLSERMLEAEPFLMADVLYGLATLNGKRGKYEQAEPLFKQALEIYERTLEVRHPQMCFLLTNLGILYCLQGKYEQAEALFERAMLMCEQVFGLEDPLTIMALTNLANLYEDQGKYEQAESLYERCLRIYEQALGSEHSQVAFALYGLARISGAQGKYERAEQLFRHALRLWEQALGSEHPQVADPLHGLAEIYRERGEYEQAEQLYRRSLHIREQALDVEHPDIAISLTGLAALYSEQGKYKAAMPLYRRALALRQRSQGLRHPDVAETMYYFARFYEMQQRLEEAFSLYQQALEIREQALGVDHPKTKATRLACTRLLQESGSLEGVGKRDR